MAGLDYEVHEKVKIGDDFRWGCHNKPRTRANLKVKAGFRLVDEGNGIYSSEQMFKTIKDFGSLECRNDQSLTDIHCRGCYHAGSGEAYSLDIRTRGT